MQFASTVSMVQGCRGETIASHWLKGVAACAIGGQRAGPYPYHRFATAWQGYQSFRHAVSRDRCTRSHALQFGDPGSALSEGVDARDPQHHHPSDNEFTRTVFYRQFTALNKPGCGTVTVWSGDTIHTTTVDAGGTDEKGVTGARRCRRSVILVRQS